MIHKMAAPMNAIAIKVFVLLVTVYQCYSIPLPVVINTWPFTNATLAAWQMLTNNRTAVDAVEAGCSECELERCDGSVGWGNHPDEAGETTLDAMIMDGITHDVGAVGAIRRVKTAISVARAVMERTTHTLLVGDQATSFAKELGFQISDLHSNTSVDIYNQWKQNNCQPNYWKNVVPDPTKSCGPYKPKPFPPSVQQRQQLSYDAYKQIGGGNHDTIGMIAIDINGNVAGGTSTNGLNHKIPGFYAVMLMKTGVSPSVASAEAMKSMIKYYPDFVGAVLAVNTRGEHGAACHGIPQFPYSIISPDYPQVTVLNVPCI